MPSSFRKLVIGLRSNGGEYDANGNWVEGTGTLIALEASVQPLSAKEMEMLPEGRRTKAAYRLYSDLPLNPLGSENPDRVTLYGDEFEVLSVETWKNDVIPNYKIIVSKVSQESGAVA